MKNQSPKMFCAESVVSIHTLPQTMISLLQIIIVYFLLSLTYPRK